MQNIDPYLGHCVSTGFVFYLQWSASESRWLTGGRDSSNSYAKSKDFITEVSNKDVYQWLFRFSGSGDWEQENFL